MSQTVHPVLGSIDFAIDLLIMYRVGSKTTHSCFFGYSKQKYLRSKTVTHFTQSKASGKPFSILYIQPFMCNRIVKTSTKFASIRNCDDQLR